MTDHYWPSLLEPASSQLEILSSAGRFQSPLSGFTRTVSRPGERMRLTLSFQNTNSAMRAAVQYAIARMQGATHRIWAHDHSNRIRGSFPATELLANNTFADGTTGWSTTNGTLTVADRIARFSPASAAVSGFHRSVGLTQYAPHILRSVILDGAQSSGLTIGPDVSDSVTNATDYSAIRGLRSAVLVALSAGAGSQIPAWLSSASGFTVGAYYTVPWCSLSRCALVDNGPNLLLRSEQFDNGSWTNVRSTDAAETSVAPDGTATGDNIIEDATASNTHYIAQDVTVGSAAADYVFSVSVQPNSRTFARISLREGTGSHECYVDVNLSTGALGTPTSGGANWTNPRAFVVNKGGGWFRVSIVGRKTNAATTVTPIIYLASALGTISYSGDGTSNIRAWGASLAQSSVPVRYVATTTAAVAATAQAASGPLHTKGWPASTNGLLLPGDQVQIGNQLHIVTASVNSDASGLATLECYPARRSAPADNAPVIVNQPMAKFFLESDANGWGNEPGIFSDAEIVLAEAA